MTSPLAAAVEPSRDQQLRAGLIYAVAAQMSWGFIAFYFKAVGHVGAWEILAHRVIWSVVFLGGLLAWQGRWREGLAALRDRRSMLTLMLTMLLIGQNWFTFIWAVTHDVVREASLGYYINPLVNVFLAFVFLRERLRRAQWVAVAIAFVAVVLMTIQLGRLPIVSLALAVSFALYGLLRKTMRVDALVGLMLETTMLLPIAVGYLWWIGSSGDLVFGNLDRTTDGLLILGGLLTALPLLWYTSGARRLNYTTMGILQYIAPTFQFLSAVVAFGEPFGGAQAVAFGLTWTALVIYTVDSVRHARRTRTRRA